ncbi:Predicted two-component sensor histidine kinase [Desulfamplus magnetovallimortis]|uniref:histidine kinase n=1 Tax=Desulfamplus magnetovallimortis TaxID=1246637 RepID=A0A1W1H548_9BACT|nr:ATP-binding protein [Desulfamplus magnetovallimortis]SLM27576.1 Predicted two-component sensor histidine kinase [Desulfamplus magnetovallimortis]
MIYGNDVENHYLLKAIETIKRQIVVISPDYRILASNCNPNKSYFLNRNSSEGEICHKALFNLEIPCINCPATEVKKTGRPSLKQILIEQDEEDEENSEKSSCLYAYPMPTTDSTMDEDAIVVLDFDLPSLFRYDEKRATSNAFLRNLIHSAADGVIAADMTGKIIIFNKAATKISGYSKQDAIENLNIRNLYPPGDAHKIMQKMRSNEYGGKGVVKAHKQVAIRKDGSTTPISLNASIVYENGKEVASIGFFHDLTEAKRLEAELEKMQIQLLQAEKMSSLGKLAAGVAHQLNNPLGGITLFTQLILEEHDVNEDVKSDLLRIQRDAERCSSIVKELLEFARQTKREVRLQNINKIIGRTLFLLKNQAIFQNIKIIEEYDTSLPEIPADVQQLNHVFMNIILNAADAMEGAGTLRLRTSPDQDNKMALITISDTGPGIPEPIIGNIFEPFFTTKEEGKGTGLGLSMAYGIVESHNGKISVENLENGGAMFSIKLPLKQKTES